MLVGYVSDERYVALDGVSFEFESGDGSVDAHSRATGAVYADIQPGTHHCDTPAAGICQPEPALNRCGSMRLTNFHFVRRACTPPQLSDERFQPTIFPKKGPLMRYPRNQKRSRRFLGTTATKMASPGVSRRQQPD